MKYIYLKCEVPDYTDNDKFIACLHQDYEGKYEQLTTIEQVIQQAIAEYEAGKLEEMHLNMQYYGEYIALNGYITPQEWIRDHKHF